MSGGKVDEILKRKLRQFVAEERTVSKSDIILKAYKTFKLYFFQ